MRNHLFTLSLLLLTGAVYGQSRPAPDYEKMALTAARSWIDLDYVGDNIIGHRLDIHLPAEGSSPFPVVIAIYGSAWFSNSSKSATYGNGLGQKLLDSGFALVSINHRSSSDAKFPAQIQDVKAAVRFLRANAHSFSLDTSFVGITGWSSGGHLAALTGVTNGIGQFSRGAQTVEIEGEIGKFTDQSSRVDAVVDWFGPTDFLIMDSCGSSFSHDAAKSPESSLIGGPIQDHPEKCQLANPITYVRADHPPFLIFHGNKDRLVPHCQSEQLFEKLQAEDGQNKFVLIQDGAHGPGVMIDAYYEQMVHFFKRQLK